MDDSAVSPRCSLCQYRRTFHTPNSLVLLENRLTQQGPSRPVFKFCELGEAYNAVFGFIPVGFSTISGVATSRSSQNLQTRPERARIGSITGDRRTSSSPGAVTAPDATALDGSCSLTRPFHRSERTPHRVRSRPRQWQSTAQQIARVSTPRCGDRRGSPGDDLLDWRLRAG